MAEPTKKPGAARAAIDAYLGGATTPISYTRAPGTPNPAWEAFMQSRGDRIAQEEAAARLAAATPVVTPVVVQEPGWSHDTPSTEPGSHFSGPVESRPVYDSWSSWVEDVKEIPSGNFGVGIGRNVGGPVDNDDIWGPDPLATPAAPVQLQPTAAPAPATLAPQGNPYGDLKNTALQAGVAYALGDPTAGYGRQALTQGIGGFLGLNKGGWVGKRCAYLNQGGMAMEQAAMQAYNEANGMMEGGPEVMMPEGTPMPDQYNPTTFGYIPSGAPKSYKEQMESDKVYIQQEKAMQDEDRKERAFEAGERRKEEAHQKAMMQKDEQHAESMKQKRSGPLGE